MVAVVMVGVVVMVVEVLMMALPHLNIIKL